MGDQPGVTGKDNTKLITNFFSTVSKFIRQGASKVYGIKDTHPWTGFIILVIIILLVIWRGMEGTTTEVVDTPGAQTPGVQTPGVQTPGAQTPGAQTPGGRGTGNRGTSKCTALTFPKSLQINEGKHDTEQDFKCDKGFSTPTKKVICKNGSWKLREGGDTKTPICYSNCTAQTILNSVVQIIAGDHGTIQPFNCDKGFSTPTKKVICKNGSWKLHEGANTKTPTCYKNCAKGTFGKTVLKQDVEHNGSVAKIDCGENKSSEGAKCLNGVWVSNKGKPTTKWCFDDCKKNILKGKITGDLKHGSLGDVICSPHFKSTISEKARCVDSNWVYYKSGGHVSCSKIKNTGPKKCKASDLHLLNGTITEKGPINSGTHVNIICNKNFINDKYTATCNDGLWVKSKGSCKLKSQCDSLKKCKPGKGPDSSKANIYCKGNTCTTQDDSDICCKDIKCKALTKCTPHCGKRPHSGITVKGIPSSSAGDTVYDLVALNYCDNAKFYPSISSITCKNDGQWSTEATCINNPTCNTYKCRKGYVSVPKADKIPCSGKLCSSKDKGKCCRIGKKCTSPPNSTKSEKVYKSGDTWNDKCKGKSKINGQAPVCNDGNWSHKACLPLPPTPQNCKGEWSTCDSSCNQTYKITQSLTLNGNKCMEAGKELRTGSTKKCTGPTGCKPCNSIDHTGVRIAKTDHNKEASVTCKTNYTSACVKNPNDCKGTCKNGDWSWKKGDQDAKNIQDLCYKKCGTFDGDSRGQATLPGGKHGVARDVKCMLGFIKKGDPKIYCDNGKWTGAIQGSCIAQQQCKNFTCPKAYSPKKSASGKYCIGEKCDPDNGKDLYQCCENNKLCKDIHKSARPDQIQSVNGKTRKYAWKKNDKQKYTRSSDECFTSTVDKCDSGWGATKPFKYCEKCPAGWDNYGQSRTCVKACSGQIKNDPNANIVTKISNGIKKNYIVCKYHTSKVRDDQGVGGEGSHIVPQGEAHCQDGIGWFSLLTKCPPWKCPEISKDVSGGNTDIKSAKDGKIVSLKQFCDEANDYKPNLPKIQCNKGIWTIPNGHNRISPKCNIGPKLCGNKPNDNMGGKIYKWTEKKDGNQKNVKHWKTDKIKDCFESKRPTCPQGQGFYKDTNGAEYCKVCPQTHYNYNINDKKPSCILKCKDTKTVANDKYAIVKEKGNKGVNAEWDIQCIHNDKKIVGSATCVNGKWNNNQPVHCSEQTCPIIGTKNKAGVNQPVQKHSVGGNPLNLSTSNFCKEGYIPNPSSITCNQNGQWNKIPKCVKLSPCPLRDPLPGENTKAIFSKAPGKEVKLETVCKSDYHYIINNKTDCNKFGGKWTTAVPSDKNISRCKDPSIICNNTIKGSIWMPKNMKVLKGKLELPGCKKVSAEKKPKKSHIQKCPKYIKPYCETNRCFIDKTNSWTCEKCSNKWEKIYKKNIPGMETPMIRSTMKAAVNTDRNQRNLRRTINRPDPCTKGFCDNSKIIKAIISGKFDDAANSIFIANAIKGWGGLCGNYLGHVYSKNKKKSKYLPKCILPKPKEKSWFPCGGNIKSNQYCKDNKCTLGEGKKIYCATQCNKNYYDIYINAKNIKCPTNDLSSVESSTVFASKKMASQQPAGCTHKYADYSGLNNFFPKCPCPPLENKVTKPKVTKPKVTKPKVTKPKIVACPPHIQKYGYCKNNKCVKGSDNKWSCATQCTKAYNDAYKSTKVCDRPGTTTYLAQLQGNSKRMKKRSPETVARFINSNLSDNPECMKPLAMTFSQNKYEAILPLCPKK